jgi:hypothetical protein
MSGCNTQADTLERIAEEMRRSRICVDSVSDAISHAADRIAYPLRDIAEREQ